MSIRAPKRQATERGYIMLTLLLAMALMVIFAGVIVPSITFEIKRDREEEMIHRGAQYSRAIRAYYKKFGRYPTKIEDLESTSNLRFLRKRYKDPMNCKNTKCADFKLLHYGEVQMSLSGLRGGAIPGANPLGAAGGLNGSTGFPQTSALAGNNPYAGNSSPVGQPQQPPSTVQSGSDPAQPGTAAPGDSTGPGSASPGSNQIASGQIIGGPIIGVAPTSKDPTIREYNKKKKYKDWVFIYDPAQDQGRLITTPYQPQLLQGFGQPGMQNNNGQPANGQPPNGTGSGNSGFGTSPTGTQNNQTPPPAEASGQTNAPNSPPEQQ
jgi:type II secretory pathway pseudopilin PulG